MSNLRSARCGASAIEPKAPAVHWTTVAGFTSTITSRQRGHTL